MKASNGFIQVGVYAIFKVAGAILCYSQQRESVHYSGIVSPCTEYPLFWCVGMDFDDKVLSLFKRMMHSA